MSTAGLTFVWIKKQGVLLILLFAFLLTSVLVVQQQRTIDSQRTLIHQLFRDSLELNAMKMKAATAHMQP